MTSVRDSAYFKKWYATNREKLNAKRRKRYALDPSARDRALNYQAEYRQRVERVSTRGQPHFRTVNGANVQVFRIHGAASMIGCSIEFIRKYELAGVIPKSIFPSTQRYYTQSQINLMKDFYEAMSLLSYSKDQELKQLSRENHRLLMQANWLNP